MAGLGLLVVLAVPPVAIYLDARSDLARERRRVDAEIAIERARLEKVPLPCLRGQPPAERRRARLLPLFIPDEKLVHVLGASRDGPRGERERSADRRRDPRVLEREDEVERDRPDAVSEHERARGGAS